MYQIFYFVYCTRKIRYAKLDENRVPIVQVNVGDLGFDEDQVVKYFESLRDGGKKMVIDSKYVVKIWLIADYFQDRRILGDVWDSVNNHKIEPEHFLQLTKVTHDFDPHLMRHYANSKIMKREIEIVRKRFGRTFQRWKNNGFSSRDAVVYYTRLVDLKLI